MSFFIGKENFHSSQGQKIEINSTILLLLLLTNCQPISESLEIFLVEKIKKKIQLAKS